MKKTVTAPVRDLVIWISENPDKHGKSVPRRKREHLRDAEALALVAYGSEGWRVTPHGATALQAVN